ncbi:mgc81809 protein [Karstenula rhodostoma CBS 690.94]|uniref:Mgc81809 protein n=1 Tax=Karstenula rhodostoma CBS 690.94 TaxID=1392251 RepID=A0A9P4P5C2_9PLEO|nr:mgc81809 protein [Karstenula rhodostoma CBS 690.94]
MMETKKVPLSPPTLQEIAVALQSPLAANYAHATVDVVPCPDLRKAPFHLATRGLSGAEKISDVGGQPNLFPTPRLTCKWSLLDIARAMEMDPQRGGLLGAGAGPFHVVGRNCELVPNVSWKDGFDNVTNGSCLAQIKQGHPSVEKSPSLDCALMINLYGSLGDPGPVLRITAQGRVGGEKSITELMRKALAGAYGERMVSLGGVFVVKRGRAKYHIMPDFPPETELPFKSAKQLNDWLTYHDFEAPMVCLSVLHSADPGKQLELRMEHTHCASMDERDVGGHYHGDVKGEEVEYEGYFNVAKTLYRIEKPEVTLERDLHH